MKVEIPPRPPDPGGVDPKTLTLTRAPLKQMDLSKFPDQPLNDRSGLPGTIENYEHAFKANHIRCRTNVITKKTEVIVPGHEGSVENAANTAITEAQSLAARHFLPIGPVQAMLDLFADRNPYNPVRTWIESRKWDGVDRLPAICATLVTEPEFPLDFRDLLIRKWLLSAAAAALSVSGFRSRGVLTLQGPQGLGKTTWVRNLVPDAALSAEVVRLDHHLDASNKDSILIAIGHWLVEIGELESSFKRDVARLKGFLTLDRDKVRRPYAKEATEYPRRTVFCASVNSHDFLLDGTGNSRFWTLPLVAVNHGHGVDMQQVFAQLAADFQNGAEWWLNEEEEQRLSKLNTRHRAFSPVLDILQSFVDFEPAEGAQTETLTATEVLVEAGVERPTSQQVKECAAVLREHLGAPKRIRGRDKYRIVRRREEGDDEPKELIWPERPEKPKFI